MKSEEAESLVTMLAAATSKRLTPDEKVVWEEQFRPLDADLATQAVLAGRNSWQFFPSWAQFREVYHGIRRRLEAEDRREARQAEYEVEGKHGYATPEWVWIWTWARFYRDPRETRSFPQQGDFGDPFDKMTQGEYETLRSEWVAAGSPKENPLNLMSGISEMSKKMAEEVVS